MVYSLYEKEDGTIIPTKGIIDYPVSALTKAEQNQEDYYIIKRHTIPRAIIGENKTELEYFASKMIKQVESKIQELLKELHKEKQRKNSLSALSFD